MGRLDPFILEDWNLLNKTIYLAWNLMFHHFQRFRYKPISNLWGVGCEMILCISKICFYSATYMTPFDSLIYNKNVAHKYLRHFANNSIQIYFT
jgi:hypothetical protein